MNKIGPFVYEKYTAKKNQRILLLTECFKLTMSHNVNRIFKSDILKWENEREARK